MNLPGMDNICKLLTYTEEHKDLWLIYEVCPGSTMNEELFNIKGEFYCGERIYMCILKLFLIVLDF